MQIVDYMSKIYNMRKMFEGLPVRRFYNWNCDSKALIYPEYIKNARVLDFNCGNDTLPGELKALCWSYDTFDRDEGNKKAAKHRLEEIKGVYDVIIASHCFEHYERIDDVIGDLKYLSGHCKVLIVSVPNHGVLHDSRNDDITHNLVLNSVDFMCILHESGFMPTLNIISDLSRAKTSAGQLRYFVRFVMAFLLVASPFYNYTLICYSRYADAQN
jgi:hypothetical protein